MVWRIILSVAIGYLLGCFSGAEFIGKRFAHINIREYGSGNPGTTNMLRTAGLKYAVPTLVIDVVKAVLASLIGMWLVGGTLGAAIGGYACILGHSFPVFKKFKGGKGVAAFAGVMIVLNPLLGSILLALGLLLNVLVKVYSVVSIFGTLFAAICFTIFSGGDIPSIVFMWVMVVQSVIMHRENILRLFKGTESKIDPFGKGEKKKRDLR